MTNESKDTTHFVCTGECGGMSPEPGVCKDEKCSKRGQPLTPCGCTDGSHQKEEEAAHG